MLAGESVIGGGVPTPLSEMICGLPGTSSAIESVPSRALAADGVKVTAIWHDAKTPPFTGSLQVSEALKSPAAETFDMVTGTAPAFVTVTVCGALVVPTGWGAKATCAGNAKSEGSLKKIETLPSPRLGMATSGVPSLLKSATAKVKGAWIRTTSDSE